MVTCRLKRCCIFCLISAWVGLEKNPGGGEREVYLVLDVVLFLLHNLINFDNFLSLFSISIFTKLWYLLKDNENDILAHKCQQTDTFLVLLDMSMWFINIRHRKKYLTASISTVLSRRSGLMGLKASGALWQELESTQHL